MITFAYPAYADPVFTDTITLPNPEPGETTTVKAKVIMNRYMTGKVTTAVQALERSREQELIEIRLMRIQDYFEARAFFKAAQGEYVLYTDINGKQWKCLLVNAIEYTNDKNSSWVFSLQLKKYE